MNRKLSEDDIRKSSDSSDIDRDRDQRSLSGICFGQSRGSSIDSVVCRICQSSSDELSMISPCLCKGSMKYVHLECLELWLNRSGLTRCELCLHNFQTHETLRYGCFESVLVWYRNPDNRNLLMSDLLIYSILSFVCFMLTLVCMLVLRFQHSEHDPFGEELAKVAVICFLSLVVGMQFSNSKIYNLTYKFGGDLPETFDYLV
uniref:RING-CH-type domain-containing protein n=1 Tax=Anopheles christyi TaxID=43041 RepID=A0A182KA92_9DIPT